MLVKKSCHRGNCTFVEPCSLTFMFKKWLRSSRVEPEIRVCREHMAVPWIFRGLDGKLKGDKVPTGIKTLESSFFKGRLVVSVSISIDDRKSLLLHSFKLVTLISG